MTLGIAQGTTDRILAQIEDWLSEQVKPELMPKDVLGCGNYGCVYETIGEPSVVIKVTTDPAEVFFVQTAMTFDHWPDGIVRYQKILQAPEQLYKKREVFVIWREAAEDVGKILDQLAAKTHYDVREKQRAFYRLMQFKRYAHELRESLNRSKDSVKLMCDAKEHEDWARDYISEEDWDYAARRDWAGGREGYVPTFMRFRGAIRVAYLLRACDVTAEFMENESILDRVGDALRFYLQKHVLMADVHAGNIGKVFRDGYWMNVITDPGHALDLRPLLSC